MSKDGSYKPRTAISAILLATCAIGSGCNSENNSSQLGPAQLSGCSAALATDRVIVKVKSGEEAGMQSDQNSEISSAAAVASSAIASVSGGVDHAMAQITNDTFSVELQAGELAGELAEKLSREPQVEYAEPDYLVHATASFSDPENAKVWAFSKIRSETAWDLGQGSKSTIVAVLDSGVDINHNDLSPNLWRNPREIPGNGRDDDGNGKADDVFGWDFANNDSNPTADDAPTYHGTHCAGTIGAAGGNGIGIVGHSPQVSLMALKFLGSNGSGYTSNAVKAVDYAISKGVKVISNSWGSFTYSQAMADAVERARSKNILFIAAAGNSGNNNDRKPFYPANYRSDNVLSVAATDSLDRLASFSNYGSQTVHIGAPGVGIYSTKNGNAYQYLSGTSMATPLVSGVAALLVSKRPDLNYRQIRSALLNSTDQLTSLRGKVSSGGRINAYRALSLVSSGNIPDSPPSLPPASGGSPSTPNPCLP